MPADEKAPKSGRVSPAAQRGGGRSELAGLRATCRRQAHALDAAMSTLRQRVAALTATNTDLRSQNDRLTPTRDTVGLEVEDRGAGA
jgi:hypothetical protein